MFRAATEVSECAELLTIDHNNIALMRHVMRAVKSTGATRIIVCHDCYSSIYVSVSKFIILLRKVHDLGISGIDLIATGSKGITNCFFTKKTKSRNHII